jgi:DNA repair exonuclease SbcCD nuclease subunit
MWDGKEMKYLYMQDFHISGKNSRNRLGNYFEDCMSKLDEIIQIAKNNNCEAILDGGDLTETKNPSYNVLDEICDRIETAKMPIYSLYGNHFMHCGHIENSQNTGLTHLQRRSKYFKYLDQIVGDNFIIGSIDYDYGIEEKLKTGWDSNFPDEYSSFWKILIVHALVTPTKFFENASHLTPEQFKTNADLILVAHYHTPYAKKVNGTEYLDIGCTGRLNINEAKIEPSVLILDTNKRSYEIVKLKSAKKPEEIFDLEKYAEIKKNEKGIDQFINSLNNYQYQAMDVGSQIKQIGKDNKFTEKPVDYLLDKMVEIEEK